MTDITNYFHQTHRHVAQRLHQLTDFIFRCHADLSGQVASCNGFCSRHGFIERAADSTCQQQAGNPDHAGNNQAYDDCKDVGAGLGFYCS